MPGKNSRQKNVWLLKGLTFCTDISHVKPEMVKELDNFFGCVESCEAEAFPEMLPRREVGSGTVDKRISSTSLSINICTKSGENK